jgi:hypothetical protein
MLSKLLGRFRGSPKEPLREVVDPILGPCVPDQAERWWRASAEVGSRKIAFTLGGDSEPDPALLAHARQIVGDLDAFERRVAEFLKGVAAGFKDADARAEVEGLRIDDVCLFWPDRPNDGMIYFAGPSEERVWRCDYVDGRCQRLGCDT